MLTFFFSCYRYVLLLTCWINIRWMYSLHRVDFKFGNQWEKVFDCFRHNIILLWIEVKIVDVKFRYCKLNNRCIRFWFIYGKSVMFVWKMILNFDLVTFYILHDSENNYQNSTPLAVVTCQTVDDNFSCGVNGQHMIIGLVQVQRKGLTAEFKFSI